MTQEVKTEIITTFSEAIVIHSDGGDGGQALADHIAAADPHPQYATDANLAATNAQVAAKADSSALTAHTSITNGNPHGTTAAQVGAYSIAQVDTALAGKANTSHNQPWNTITTTPTTIAGYGITDAVNSSAVGTTIARLSGGQHLATESRASTISYNSANGVISFTDARGTLTTIDLPIENLFQNASYNSGTQTLTLTTNGGGTLNISLATLVDLPEIVIATSNPGSNPTTGQRLYLRSDTGEYWISTGTAWAGPFLSFTSAERTKLAGIQTGATANSTDAQLRDRNTHTGTQDWATTISGKPTTIEGYGITNGVTSAQRTADLEFFTTYANERGVGGYQTWTPASTWTLAGNPAPTKDVVDRVLWALQTIEGSTNWWDSVSRKLNQPFGTPINDSVVKWDAANNRPFWGLDVSGFTYRQQSPPSNPNIGETWREISGSDLVLGDWQWNGSIWLSIAYVAYPIYSRGALSSTFETFLPQAPRLAGSGIFLESIRLGIRVLSASTSTNNWGILITFPPPGGGTPAILFTGENTFTLNIPNSTKTWVNIPINTTFNYDQITQTRYQFTRNGTPGNLDIDAQWLARAYR